MTNKDWLVVHNGSIVERFETVVEAHDFRQEYAYCKTGEIKVVHLREYERECLAG